MGWGHPINAILICEKIAQVNQILLYFFHGLALRLGMSPDDSSSSFSCQPDVWLDYAAQESGKEWTICVQTFEISSLAFEKTEAPYKSKKVEEKSI